MMPGEDGLRYDSGDSVLVWVAYMNEKAADSRGIGK